MAEKTGIEWCDHTFNPWIGCTAISPACDRCYAKTLVERWGGDFDVRRRTSLSNWRMPLRWDRLARVAGVRRRVFCASLSDVFDNQVPDVWREDLWALIRVTRNLDWLLLTKRPDNFRKMLPADWGDGWPNVWLGVTTESQPHLAHRAWLLAQIPAVVRFLSVEPMLGEINATCVENRFGSRWNALTGRMIHSNFPGVSRTGAISWVICGGESGPRRRPLDLDAARSLRDQCAEAQVPFFFKQVNKVQPIPDDLMVRKFPQLAAPKLPPLAIEAA